MQRIRVIILITFLFAFYRGKAQYVEEFTKPSGKFSEQGIPGWFAMTGDGKISFQQACINGVANLTIDPSGDTRNIWYAFIQTNIAEVIKPEVINKNGGRVRISARVRPSHGPRRINLQISSIDGQSYLREFDLAEAGQWYNISFTTQAFHAREDRPLLAQVSLMDWGIHEKYALEVDFVKVDVVTRKETLTPDEGNPLEYRPALLSSERYKHSLPVSDDAMVDIVFPTLNFNQWVTSDSMWISSVNSGTRTLLRWNFSDFKGKKIIENGQLVIFTHHVARMKKNPKDFGEIRVFEIIGKKLWNETDVTYENLLDGSPEYRVINSRTIIDSPVTPGLYGRTIISISKPVLQRLADGVTQGLVIAPLGAIDFSLLTRENANGKYSAILCFNAQ